MIQPAVLQKNDVVGIVAPGRKLDADTIQAANRMIESFGYKVQAGNNLSSNAHSYLSGTDDERLNDFQKMLNDPSLKAIICARGGYGTTRILDRLDFTAFLKNPKWICGFSDITALHLKLQKIGVQSIHATMPVLFSKPESVNSVKALFNVLIGESVPLEATSNSKNISGKATGNLIGGNLSLIVDSLGTSSEVDTKNKILVIEEVDEYFYRIDRMLVQLNRANKLHQLAGLVVGHMTDIKESELSFGESIEEIVLNHVREFNFPVGFCIFRLATKTNIAWVEGSTGTLIVSKRKSSVTF